MNRRDVLRACVGATTLAIMSSPIGARQGTPVAANDPANPFLFGNGLHLVPAGKLDTVEVVSHGTVDMGWLPFVIRNTTGSPIEVTDVVGAFRDASDKLLDTVMFADFAPRTLLPNGVAIGYATFDKDAVPLDAQIDLVPKFTPGPSTRFVELPIIDLEADEYGFDGTVQNTTAGEISNIQVLGVTIGEDGAPMGSFSSYVEPYEVPAGAVGPFDAVLNGERSPTYLAAAYVSA
jgi:hypothetical protein